MILTLDFETKDPYIDRGLGGGWCYPNSDFKVLGCSLKINNLDSQYIAGSKDISLTIQSVINGADTIIMHNATYDLGCLKYLGIKVHKDIKIIDTIIMAKLHDNSLGIGEYNLDSLSQRYLGKRKDNKALAQAVRNLDLYPYTKTELKRKEKSLKDTGEYLRDSIADNDLIKWSKSNMDVLQDKALEVIAKYAQRDTDNTYELFMKFKELGVDLDLTTWYSKLTRIVTDYRSKGVRIDLTAANAVLRLLQIETIKVLENLYRLAGEEFNISSSIDVPRVLERAGLKLPKTGKGNKSATSSWLDKQDDPICRALIEARKVTKMKNDFVSKIIEMAIPEEEEGYARVYPQLNLFEAVTGRFSCSSPNLQQIPSRDSKYASMIKSMFVPEKDEKWFELDYSNQEGRLQVHYAYLLGCDGASDLKVRFDNDPAFDMHQKIADMIGIDRKTAKTINLGLSYGMGITKLQNTVGNSWDAKELKEAYKKKAPFLDQLNKKCQDAIKQRGYVKTLGGRRVRIDKPTVIDGELKTFEYTALNRLIQGSAADQTIVAMIKAYEENIHVLFPIHDAICMSGTEHQANRMKEIMQDCCKLEIPVIVEMKELGGKNWADAAH